MLHRLIEGIVCEQCQKAGVEHRVYEGAASATLGYFKPFYDTKGRRHHHDGNRVEQGYECSEGHRWSQVIEQTCWCGWSNKRAKPKKPVSDPFVSVTYFAGLGANS